MKEFFKHENQLFPSALSDNGKLHSCQKSQLADILQSHVNLPETEPTDDTIIIDWSALIYALPPSTARTFEDYANEKIIPRVQRYGAKYNRVYVIFDVYNKSSLKDEARVKKGKELRRRVTGTSKIPTKWKGFLRNDANKNELFKFLADKISAAETTSKVIVTKGEEAVSNSSHSLDGMPPCCHEEADTRIFVHARDAVNPRWERIPRNQGQ